MIRINYSRLLFHSNRTTIAGWQGPPFARMCAQGLVFRLQGLRFKGCRGLGFSRFKGFKEEEEEEEAAKRSRSAAQGQ